MKDRSVVRFRVRNQAKGFVKMFDDSEERLMRMFLRTIRKVDGIELGSIDLTSESAIDLQYYNVL